MCTATSFRSLSENALNSGTSRPWQGPVHFAGGRERKRVRCCIEIAWRTRELMNRHFASQDFPDRFRMVRILRRCQR